MPRRSNQSLAITCWRPCSFELHMSRSHQPLTQDLISWLQHLTSDLKYDGWRFDFVKGYAGWHVRDYIQATSPQLAVGEFWDTCAYDEEGVLKPDQVPLPSSFALSLLCQAVGSIHFPLPLHQQLICPFGVLEQSICLAAAWVFCLQDDHRQRTIDWCDQTSGTSAAFDFTTKAVLQEALAKQEFWRLRDSQGHPPGVLGWWPQRAVAFLDNHDTGSTQAHWPFPEQFLRQVIPRIAHRSALQCP